MADFTIDTSDLTALANDLDAAGPKAAAAVIATTKKAAHNIRDDGRKFAAGIRHVPMLPYTINYDVEVEPTGVSAEIGPDADVVVGGGPHRTPGNLGAIIEYGSPTSAPHAFMAPAFDRELPEWIKHLEAAAGDVL